jgi:hypothetical protein
VKTQVNITALLLAAVLLAGGCSKQSTHVSWSSSQSILVEPGMAIGSVHSGTTIQQVLAEIGQPDQTIVSASPEINGALIYTNIGLSVIPSGNGVVHSVGVRTPFVGRTKEGIGIGSSRADIVKAYGEPTASKPIRSDVEVLRYEALGIRFQLVDGKIDSIVVILKGSK